MTRKSAVKIIFHRHRFRWWNSHSHQVAW